MYKRTLYLSEIVKRKSVFLLGPRQTGKSTLLRTQFPNARYVDLLEAPTFRELSRSPETLRERMRADETLVIIDEIQKLPALLDEIQLMIDRNKNLRFLLTGSSARKLRKGGANLLGGRANFLSLHPLTTSEVGAERLPDLINWGGLPAILDSTEQDLDLTSYVGVYLKEEIAAEGLSRSIENFSRFLSFASHFNGQQLNYTKIGNDAQVPPRTIKDYVQVLKDTLVAHTLEPLRISGGRKSVSIEKFYFFDTGVARNLAQRGLLTQQTPEYGQALEHQIFLEIVAYRSYTMNSSPLNYWRTHTQLEVDFILNQEIAIEVKSTSRISHEDAKGLRALAEEIPLKRQLIVCQEREPRVVNGVEIWPVKNFCESLWRGEII